MSGGDDGTIDLRGDKAKDVEEGIGGGEPEFRIGNVSEEGEDEKPLPVSSASSDIKAAEEMSGEKVRLKFDKFVNLIANNNYDEIYEKYVDEDVIISASLLTDLASTEEGKKDKKIVVVFVVGITLGILVTWFLLKT